MKATEVELLEYMKTSPQFVIPIYQRTYSWTEKECRQLWDDIIRAGGNDSVPLHFIGSIVCIEGGLSVHVDPKSLLVIDGQQRLTTVTLLLAALANALGDDEPVDGFSAQKLREYYLLNRLEKGDRRFKLLLSQTDKTSLIAILSDDNFPEDRSIRVSQNFAFFENLIASSKSDREALCKGLTKLFVVGVAINREHDNPQLIFESMNSTGRELSQADLIRNFVLMGQETDLQTHLYVQYWRPMEVAFGQEVYNKHFDAFMRHYLTVKTGEIPRLSDVYEAFKSHARSPITAEAGVEALVKDIREFARYYCAMAIGKEKDKDLGLAFRDLRELKVDVAYPFLLELYDDYEEGTLPGEDFVEVVRLVEAYVFRRAICAIPTNSLNKTFATFTKALKKDRYLESIQAHFFTMPSYRRFPRDIEFIRDMQTRDLYNFRSRSYWLRRFENFGRKERVLVDDYTIEHIMPQNENLSDVWQQELGPDWQQVRDTWLHTLGNLTLTGYNSEYSDRPFIEKRDMKNGFGKSPLKVNEGLAGTEKWGEDAIQSRAGKLAKMAATVWSAPKLSAEVIAEFEPDTPTPASYSIDDHPHLSNPEIRKIFDAFRKEVFALDPCVAEEFLKLYVAYKAETNFVDVVPQAKQLRLFLNMNFADISDPHEICRDVTDIGRWGNGDVEVYLGKMEDIPDVIGLVRQSLERQLGNGESE